jgi:hypothetical protein
VAAKAATESAKASRRLNFIGETSLGGVEGFASGRLIA